MEKHRIPNKKRNKLKANGKFQCTLCRAHTEIAFDVPNMLAITFVKVDCSGCESKFLLKLQRINYKKDHYNQWVSCTFKSPKAEHLEKINQLKSRPKNPYDRMG